MTTKQKAGVLVGSFAGLLLIILKLWGKIERLTEQRLRRLPEIEMKAHTTRSK